MTPSLRFAIVVCVVALAAVQARRPTQLRDFSAVTELDDRNELSANVSAGDVDGDGDVDLVFAIGRHDGGRNKVLFNDGKGRFTATDLGSKDDASYSALLADIDGDNDLDVIVSNDFDVKTVFVNDGKGHFRQAPEWGSADWPSRNATAADLNGDKRPDIIVANRSPRSGLRSAFCLNNGVGLFPACTELPVPPATSIVAADVDRDGDVDLIVPNRDGGENVLLYNDGHAGFDRTMKFGPSTTAARTAAAGDLNGDGWPDLIIGDENVGSFLYLNDGRGAFQPARLLKLDSLVAPYSIALGDLNRDGALDVVLGYSGARGSVLFNDSTGRSFKHVRFGEAVGTPYGLAIADLDGDKFPEIIAARNGMPNQVFFNRAGDGVDTIAASDEFKTPLSVNPAQPFSVELLFAAKPARTNAPLLGIWQGQSSYLLDYRSELQVRIDALTVGERSGYSAQSTNGVIYCLSVLTLKEERASGEYLFGQIGQTGISGCTGPQESLYVASLDAQGRLHWDGWPKTEQPRSRRAILERKK